MPIPENTLPMMMGTGPFGAIDMGGMFTTVKVRDGLKRDDYKNPGNYKHPAGTVAHAVDREAPPIERKNTVSTNDADVKVRKPTGHSGH